MKDTSWCGYEVGGDYNLIEELKMMSHIWNLVCSKKKSKMKKATDRKSKKLLRDNSCSSVSFM